MDIIPETINRIRLSDEELLLLKHVLDKVDEESLTPHEKTFLTILRGRIEGRLSLKEKGVE